MLVPLAGTPSKVLEYLFSGTVSNSSGTSLYKDYRTLSSCRQPALVFILHVVKMTIACIKSIVLYMPSFQHYYFIANISKTTFPISSAGRASGKILVYLSTSSLSRP